jgi:hypothetical protein
MLAPSFSLGRRAFAASGMAWLLSAISAQAQRPPAAPPQAGSAGLNAAKLQHLIDLALAEPDYTPLSRPAILGFSDAKLQTRSIERTPPGEKYGFMVIVPRREDGLVFFRGADKPLFFAIHRTGVHLNRIVSATNRDGQLAMWSDRGADEDFAKQKAFWAKQ